MPRLFPAVALALSVALPAQQAAALSCLAPDPLRSLQEAAASDETYRVLLGRLDFDAEALPVSGPAGPVAGLSEAPLVRAEFEGHALGAEGFDTAANGTLAIEPGCLGEVCGNAVPGEEVLIFARVTEAGTATPHCVKIACASREVEASPTVGPDPIIAISSPGTSEIINVCIAAG